MKVIRYLFLLFEVKLIGPQLHAPVEESEKPSMCFFLEMDFFVVFLPSSLHTLLKELEIVVVHSPVFSAEESSSH